MLANEGLRHRSIKVYLSAVRHLQISANMPDPFGGQPMSRLEYVLRGIKKQEAEKGEGPRERLPITPALLRRLHAVWEPDAELRDTKMVWAACCLCFFAFLRVGEMTVPADGVFDPAIHLCAADLAIDDPSSPTMLSVRIKQSKTDPFRQRVSLFVGRGVSPLCPIAALLSYLTVCGTDEGPLFTFQDGRYLTRQRFSQCVKAALTRAGVDQSRYGTHSFRIGAATTAAASGVEDAVIKTVGRWESLAYLQYVRIPRESLIGLSARMVARV